MTYTNVPFKVTVPSKFAPSSTLDDHIRRVKVDIVERVDSLISGAGSMASDPIVPTAGTRYMMLHFSAFRFDELTNAANQSISASWGLASRTADTKVYFARVPVPKGAIVTDVDISNVRGTSTTIAWRVDSISFATFPVTQTSHGSGSLTGTATQTNDNLVTGMTFTQGDTNALYIALTISNNDATSGFQGVRIKYTAPGMRYV